MVQDTNYSSGYFELLSEKFPTIQSAASEIIHLKSMMKLPKGTEHFISDIHGEHLAFENVLRNSSGSLRLRVVDLFSDGDHKMGQDEILEFCNLLYYPSESLVRLKNKGRLDSEFISSTIQRLLLLCKVVSRKYTQKTTISQFPKDYSYILQELLFKNSIEEDRAAYYDSIVESIIESGEQESFITSLCHTIQALCVEHLHIVGDIYDRGDGPHFVMDTLMRHERCDIQWGNHDILWIGAAAGNLACIANAIRISVRYQNMSVLEDGYRISLDPLRLFAEKHYSGDTTLKEFTPKADNQPGAMDLASIGRMQKAISIIQFKLESELIDRNDYGMDDRKIIDTINMDDWTVQVDGKKYHMNSKYLPTVSPNNPTKLTQEEEELIGYYQKAFTNSPILQRHIRFMMENGSIYLVYNNNFLIHASLPINEDLTLKTVEIMGRELSGKALLDFIDQGARDTFYSPGGNKDLFWYLWCSPDSPLFGKDKMTTFERYFIDDKSTHTESNLGFYKNLDNSQLAELVLGEFGLDNEASKIICGHVPVRYGKNESPIKAGKRIICIDAGFSKAYQDETQRAGCTLIFNSYGMVLAFHETFESVEKALESGNDMLKGTLFVDNTPKRVFVSETEDGKKYKKQIKDIGELVERYRSRETKQRE
ncbi:MAG: fructose-1,6-bisphosphatase [Eubacteriaceae bacterium]|nr:fructose-1,6-bisphosphatase [Eubacteriaceae bacterium]